MDEDRFEEDLAVTGFVMKDEPKVAKYVKVEYSETLAAGYCQKCHKRYTGAPIIKGVIHCPNCFTN